MERAGLETEVCVAGGQRSGRHDGDLLTALDLVAAVVVGLDENPGGDVLDLGVVVRGAFVDGADAGGVGRGRAAVRGLRLGGSGGRIAGRVLRSLLRDGGGLRGGIRGQEERGREGGEQRERGGEGCVARSHQGLLSAAVPPCGRDARGGDCFGHAPAPDAGGGCFRALGVSGRHEHDHDEA